MKFRNHLKQYSFQQRPKSVKLIEQAEVRQNEPSSSGWEHVEWRDDDSISIQSSFSHQVSQYHRQQRQNELVSKRNLSAVTSFLKTVTCGKRDTEEITSSLLRDVDHQMENGKCYEEIEKGSAEGSEVTGSMGSEYESAMRVYAEVLRQTSIKSSSQNNPGILKSRIFEGSVINDAIIKNDMNKSKIAQILFNIGTDHTNRQEYNEALPMLWISLQTCQSIHDKPHKLKSKAKTINREEDEKINIHELMADILQKIGFIYRMENKFNESLESCREAVIMRKKILNSVHVIKPMRKSRPNEHETTAKEHASKVASALIDVGKAQEHLRDFKEAAKTYEEVLELTRKLHPNPLDQTCTLENLNILSDLGRVYEALGDGQGGNDRCYKVSMQYFRELHRIRVHKLGKSHFSIADSLNSIGRVYLRRGKINKSFEALWRALDIISTYGEDRSFDVVSTLTADTLSNLAMVYEKYGMIQEAHKAHSESLAIKKNILPRSDPSIVQTLNSLGAVNLMDKKYDESIQCHTEALALLKEGSETMKRHPLAADTHNFLGMTYKMKGDTKTSTSHFAKAVRIYEKSQVEPNHPGLVAAKEQILEYELNFATGIPSGVSCSGELLEV